MKTIILAEKVLMNGAWQHNQVLSIEKGVIADIAPLSYFKKDATATINERIRGAVIPGYIDTQVNGGGGAMFNHAPTLESINVMADAHLKYGTTTLFPTLITDDIDTIEQAADAVSEAIAQAHPSVEGVHFEGPHLSVEKKGVHLPRYIRALSDRELATYTRRDIGQVLI
ncbi:N-acetylglucosamine-6-phosphate deacetylase, partial [Pseudomonas sp. HMWF031]